MTKNTDTIIIKAATLVFMTHGYKRSNMSLISKQAGYSRVTIHKYLLNKDDAFRKSINQVLTESKAACEPIMHSAKSDLPCWQAIEELINQWIIPTFDGAGDHLILQELRYYAQEIAQDLFMDAHISLENMITQVLTQAVKDKHISLERLAVNESKLANLIVSSVSGIRSRVDLAEIKQANHDMVNVFKVATQD
jgi:TetR/AcrR family transcriptional repressor of nem operon